MGNGSRIAGAHALTPAEQFVIAHLRGGWRAAWDTDPALLNDRDKRRVLSAEAPGRTRPRRDTAKLISFAQDTDRWSRGPCPDPTSMALWMQDENWRP